MAERLAIIREALEEISVSGHKNIELMKMCMDALDSEIQIQRQKERAVTEDAHDQNHV